MGAGMRPEYPDDSHCGSGADIRTDESAAEGAEDPFRNGLCVGSCGLLAVRSGHRDHGDGSPDHVRSATDQENRPHDHVPADPGILHCR